MTTKPIFALAFTLTACTGNSEDAAVDSGESQDSSQDSGEAEDTAQDSGEIGDAI